MRVLRYVIQRLILTIPVIVGMSILVCLLLRLVPGDPAQVILGLRSTPEGLAIIRRDLGLDLAIHLQYLHWVGNLLHGDLGQDYRSHVLVSTLLQQRLPVTIELALISMTRALLIAIPIGVTAAAHQGSRGDWVALGLGLFGISVPDFWLGIILILTLSLGLGLFPSSGFVPMREGLWSNLATMALPALTLATGLVAALIRMTRSAMLDMLNRDFVKFLRAKGLRESLVIYKHVLRNASIPIVTMVGMEFGFLLGGAVIVEQLFSLPGVGRLIVDAMLERNYPVVQASVLVVALMFVAVNMATDILYAVLNPKLK